MGRSFFFRGSPLMCGLPPKASPRRGGKGRSEAAGEPERQDLLRFAALQGGALGVRGVDAQVAQGAVLLSRQLILGKRVVRLAEELAAKFRVGDGALEHRLDCFIGHRGGPPTTRVSTRSGFLATPTLGLSPERVDRSPQTE